MVKIVIGALVGSLIGMLGISLLTGYSLPDEGPRGDAWPAILRAELEMATPLEDDGLSTLVALAEELYWLRRAEIGHGLDTSSLLRHAGPIAKERDDDERKAIAFLIERVTASLGLELDRWQNQMAKVNALDGIERDAALRILAFAKWQQKGGAFDYAYDFFQQLSNSSVPSEATATPTVEPPAIPTPTKRAPARRPVRQQERNAPVSEP